MIRYVDINVYAKKPASDQLSLPHMAGK